MDFRPGRLRSIMNRDLVGKVQVSSGFDNGNLWATDTNGMDEWPNFSTGCTDRFSLVVEVEIGRERNVDFSDWGVIVDKTGVRPTTNRDHGSKEAERRAGCGSQTSTPSFAPPHCQRERPQQDRTARTARAETQVTAERGPLKMCDLLGLETRDLDHLKNACGCRTEPPARNA